MHEKSGTMGIMGRPSKEGLGGAWKDDGVGLAPRMGEAEAEYTWEGMALIVAAAGSEPSAGCEDASSRLKVL